MEFLTLLKKAYDEEKISHLILENFSDLYSCYSQVRERANLSLIELEFLFSTYLQKVIECIAHPYTFEPYHRAITKPFDYYSFGIEFIRPLFDEKKSKVYHLNNVHKIEKEIKLGENVILFANHQTEADPQLLSLALEKTHPELAKEIIFVAGDRVVTDPLAIPFSLGRNLLCIYSKRHIDYPPEQKRDKLIHNQKTMQLLKERLAAGGLCLFVAPSGGRDRMSAEGVVEVAQFDPNSVEMLRLMANESKKKTHFYPLALYTYDILPPPPSVESKLGEKRIANRTSALFSFSDEVDPNQFIDLEKKERRAKLAETLWNIVKQEHERIKSCIT